MLINIVNVNNRNLIKSVTKVLYVVLCVCVCVCVCVFHILDGLD